MSLTLTEFLLARIAEDEDEARHLPPPPPSSALPAGACFGCGTNLLAEAEAKRRIIDEHRDWGNPEDQEPGSYHSDICSDGLSGDYPCATLRIVAAIYADHPDYDESWRP